VSRLEQGKTCVCVANTGWQTVAQIDEFSTVQGIYEKIRTEFKGSNGRKEGFGEEFRPLLGRG
jgi:hypothetical protein